MKTAGRMTLFEVVELCDDLSQIRVNCIHQFAKLDPSLDLTETSENWLIKRANQLKGSRLSVAQVLKLKQKWRDWTWKDGANITTVQGFLCSDIVVNVCKP